MQHAAEQRLVGGIVGILCLVFCICLVIFGALIALLRVTDTPDVHGACPGLWDFVLIALLLPVLMRCMPQALLLSLLLFLTLLGTTLCVRAALQPLCTETLRRLTPPLPWLLIVACAKTVLSFAGSLTTAARMCRA
jgi:hypothetical protein